MPTAATVTFRDHADQELTLHLPAEGYPDGPQGVLLSLGRALDAYGGEEWVLRDLSFTIRPGESVAFVGHTGAGKKVGCGA